jgi:predicted dehydrogenase
MSKHGSMNRRTFLKSSSLAAGAAIALPQIVPSTVFGADAPSNRIVMGAIGVGGKGTGNLRNFLGFKNVQMIAVCDVEKKHCDRAKNYVDSKYKNKDCKSYNDFRKITRDDSIDAVSIATPDHWHVLPAIDAAKNKKDMYVEKPLTLTIAEGRVLADTVKRYGRILQTGSQQRSDSRFRKACELARNGRLGDLKNVLVRIPGNNKSCKSWKPEPIPEGFDYNFWLGQAPDAPYCKARCHYQFRFILDYSGGQVTNFGAHHLDIAQWGIGADGSGPVEISDAGGVFPTEGLFTTATKVNFKAKYANGVTLQCKTGGGSVRFEGTKGWAEVSRGKIKTEPAALAKEIFGPDEIHLYKSSNHSGNFLDCVRTRKQPICNAEIGHRSASVCHLGNIAMLCKKTLKWDPKTEKFPDDKQANAMVSRMMRSPWTL